MWKFRVTKIANEKFHAAKKSIKLWHVNADKIII